MSLGPWDWINPAVSAKQMMDAGLGFGNGASSTSSPAAQSGRGGFGVRDLGYASLGLGLIKGLGGLFGRRRSTNPYGEMESIARQQAAESDAFGGQLGSLGMDLQTSGREMLQRGRSGYLDALMNPAIAMQERAQLASQLGAASRGVGPMVGMLGGPGAAAQYARNVAQYNPALASGLTQIGSNALQRRGQGFQSMAGFGQQDFGQGLGLRQQGFGIGQQGRQRLGGTLTNIQQMKQQDALRKQQAWTAVLGAAGQAAGGGLFK